MAARFRQDDIRPGRFEGLKLEAAAVDIATLAAQRAGFVEVNCPACGGADSLPAFEKHGFAFRQCPACRTVFMSPRATPQMLAEFYRDSALYAFWNRHIFPASQEARRQNIVIPRVRRILGMCQAHGVDGDLLVEVGAGYGTFCAEMAGRGRFARVLAVEPNQELAATIRASGVEVLERSVEDLGGRGLAADVVVAFEVLEHLHAPRDFLTACAGLLKPGGLLVVTCPNYLGFEIATLGPLSDSVDHEHINLFNPDSLAGLAERCGFLVLECQTPGELDADMVRLKALAGELDLSAQPFLRAVLLECWDELGGPFQEFLKARRLSSHMWLAARRTGGEVAR